MPNPKSGIKNLKILLKTIRPVLDYNDYVFCSVTKNKMNTLKLNPLLIFKEKEGITIIITKEEAAKNKLRYDSLWSLITLHVHSDLNAVGFLAAIATKLAQSGISLNAVSAYYHDHLFVPKNRAEEALQLIKDLSKAQAK